MKDNTFELTLEHWHKTLGHKQIMGYNKIVKVSIRFQYLVCGCPLVYRSIPLTDLGRVVDCAKYQLGRPVVARADVRHVRLAGQQLLGAAKVAQLQDGRFGIEQQILWLDVAMADAHLVDVR